MVTHKTTLRIDEGADFHKIKMRQNDSGRLLEAALTFGGVAFTIPSESVIEFNAKNPKGQVVTRTAGISFNDNVVTAKIPPHVLAINGDVACEFVITDTSGEQVGTVNFIIAVWGSVLDPDAIVDLPDYEAVQSARVAAEQAAAEAQSIKDSTEVQYDVQPTRVGFKRADEATFTYTSDLKGPKGDKGDTGISTGDMLKSDFVTLDPAGNRVDEAVRNVLKAGDTMTGDLTIKKSTPTLRVISRELYYGDAGFQKMDDGTTDNGTLFFDHDVAGNIVALLAKAAASSTGGKLQARIGNNYYNLYHTGNPPAWDAISSKPFTSGTWTPALVNANLTITNRYGTYVRIGNLVVATMYVRWSAETSGSTSVIAFDGLPFPAVNPYSGVSTELAVGVIPDSGSVIASASPVGMVITSAFPQRANLWRLDSGIQITPQNTTVRTSGHISVNIEYICQG